MAFCRLVLTHQVEPAATLRRIAALLRPGGRIVAQDILEDPRYPSFDPPVPAVERILALQYEHKRRRGVFPDVARHYRTLCGEASLGLVSQRGLFTVPPDPRGPLSSMRALLSSTRRGLVEYGLATDDEIEALLQEVDRASATELHFGTSSLLVEMIAEVA